VAPSIRRYQSRDLDALYDVCVRTAADGDDLTEAIADPLLPGHVYAAAYGLLEPELAFVVEDDDGVGGYVVGTRDTVEFEERCEVEWFPALRQRYPAGSGDREADRRYIALIHAPVRQGTEIAADYPAHLHIDLLPRLQGHGLGRALIERFNAAAAAAGAAGVHLGVSRTNSRALAFYRHVGFETLRTDPMSLVLGRRLDG
jgi:ribosomal protein S18 acetylase RimI-like enzyme